MLDPFFDQINRLVIHKLFQKQASRVIFLRIHLSNRPHRQDDRCLLMWAVAVGGSSGDGAPLVYMEGPSRLGLPILTLLGLGVKLDPKCSAPKGTLGHPRGRTASMQLFLRFGQQTSTPKVEQRHPKSRVAGTLECAGPPGPPQGPHCADVVG